MAFMGRRQYQIGCTRASMPMSICIIWPVDYAIGVFGTPERASGIMVLKRVFMTKINT